MTWLPWTLRRQLRTAYRANGILSRAIGKVQRELDKLDGHEERAHLAPADRVALYLLEEKVQRKADELGKPVSTPCNRCRPLWKDGTTAETYHTHLIEPRVQQAAQRDAF